MSKESDKRQNPAYLVITPIEELIDDGISFEGDTEKDRAINMFDFSRTREILQRFSQQLTADQNETLIRFIKCCVKMDKPN
ncbi:MAG: hypothetical protein PHP96_03425 [Candidatus Dojkabacteria bacterium]|nr:hypothetical protein [Candidatus Dojkabacteria bacterium]